MILTVNCVYIVFPVRYYYIDFELAVRFEPDMPPESRRVTGIPILRRGHYQPEDYGRPIAPEILDERHGGVHDPFKADVYQLGTMFMNGFKV